MRAGPQRVEEDVRVVRKRRTTTVVAACRRESRRVGLDPVQRRHPDVDDDDLRGQPFDELEQLDAVLRLADDGQVALVLE